MAHAEVERQLRNQLQAIVLRLGHGSTLRSEPTSDPNPTRGDLVEDAQLVEARERGELTRERLARQAKSLRLALQRFETGSYGMCVECNEVIGAARLRALPSATRCIRCQQWLESVSNQFASDARATLSRRPRWRSARRG